jgi:hypothetical protein
LQSSLRGLSLSALGHFFVLLAESSLQIHLNRFP